MARFAVIANNKVENLVEAESIDVVKLLLPEFDIVEQTAATGNAFIGYKYFQEINKFEPVQPYASWIFEDSSFEWKPPKPMPSDGAFYVWSEEQLDWVDVATLVELSPEIVTATQEEISAE